MSDLKVRPPDEPAGRRRYASLGGAEAPSPCANASRWLGRAVSLFAHSCTPDQLRVCTPGWKMTLVLGCGITRGFSTLRTWLPLQRKSASKYYATGPQPSISFSSFLCLFLLGIFGVTSRPTMPPARPQRHPARLRPSAQRRVRRIAGAQSTRDARPAPGAPCCARDAARGSSGRGGGGADKRDVASRSSIGGFSSMPIRARTM